MTMSQFSQYLIDIDYSCWSKEREESKLLTFWIVPSFEFVAHMSVGLERVVSAIDEVAGAHWGSCARPI